MNTFLVATAGGFAGALMFTLIELVVFKVFQCRGLRRFLQAEMTEEN